MHQAFGPLTILLKIDMRKPTMYLWIAALLVVVAALRVYVTAGFLMGGTSIVAFFKPEALWAFYASLGLFAIALVNAIHSAFRARRHRTTLAETPAVDGDVR